MSFSKSPQQSRTGAEREAGKPDKAVVQKVFWQKDEFKEKAGSETGWKEKIDWVWRLVAKPVLFLFILQAGVYIFASFPKLSVIMLRVIDPLVLLVDLVVFAWLASQVKLKQDKSRSWALWACFGAGFGLGLLNGLFKFLWIGEYWTILAMIIEPIYLAFIAVITGWIAFSLAKK